MLASSLMMFGLLQVLVEKGTLSQPEAMSVPVRAAEMVREATEGSPRQASGEEAARTCETLGKWIMELAAPRNQAPGKDDF